MKMILRLLLVYCLASACWANDKVVNVYVWSNYVSQDVIRLFEQETGIEVNISTYDGNETLYAKLKATDNAGYDLIAPSSYYVSRMMREDFLETLDKSRLSNFKNLNPLFLNKPYDPGNQYSLPYVWGVTGIFRNSGDPATQHVKKWADLWDKQFRDQLLMLNDPRDGLGMALILLGYSVNDVDPEHLRQAYLKLKDLMPNVKIFNVDGVASLIIDEDVNLGMVWSGDAYRAQQENPKVQFIFPEDGYVVWLDCLSILKKAPHKDNAYKFLDFLMRPDIARKLTLNYGFATANLAAQKSLPPALLKNPILNPNDKLIEHGQFQIDIGDKTMVLYEKYWERLKMES